MFYIKKEYKEIKNIKKKKKIRNIEILIQEKEKVRLKCWDFSYKSSIFFELLFLIGFLIQIIIHFAYEWKLKEYVFIKCLVEKLKFFFKTNNTSFLELLLVLFWMLILEILYVIILSKNRERMDKKIMDKYEEKICSNYKIVDILELKEQIKFKREKKLNKKVSLLELVSKNITTIGIGSILVSLFNNYHLGLIRLNELNLEKRIFEEKEKNLLGIFFGHLVIYILFIVLIVLIIIFFKLVVDNDVTLILRELDEIEDFLDKLEILEKIEKV